MYDETTIHYSSIPSANNRNVSIRYWVNICWFIEIFTEPLLGGNCNIPNSFNISQISNHNFATHECRLHRDDVQWSNRVFGCSIYVYIFGSIILILNKTDAVIETHIKLVIYLILYINILGIHIINISRLILTCHIMLQCVGSLGGFIRNTNITYIIIKVNANIWTLKLRLFPVFTKVLHILLK